MIRPVLVIAVSCFLLTGCGTTRRHLSEGYGVPDLATANLNLQDTLVLKLTAPGAGHNGKALIDKSCFDFPATPAQTDDDTCTAQRNQAIAALMLASDQICLAHRKSIYGNDAIANTTLGTLTNLFAGAATIATGENPKTIYAALALFFNSERSLVNETIYKQMLATAIDQKIEDIRKTKQDALKLALTKNISDYPMQNALTDMIDLHNSCSFMEGLRAALQDGTRTPSKVERILVLKQTLAGLANEIASACKATEDPKNPDAQTAQCEGAKARYGAVSSALGALESSISPS